MKPEELRPGMLAFCGRTKKTCIIFPGESPPHFSLALVIYSFGPGDVAKIIWEAVEDLKAVDPKAWLRSAKLEVSERLE